jgi:F-type H+-transporting ATPase subunit alpha
VPVEEQCIVIYAGTKGWLDTIPVVDVRRFESELLTTFRAKHEDLLGQIRTAGTLPDTEKLDAALRSFVDSFATSN